MSIMPDTETLIDALGIELWRIPLVVLSAIAIYLTFLVFVRIFGARVLAVTSSFDVVVTIMFGAVAGRVILGHPPTLAAGVIGLFTLMAAEAVFGAVRNWRGMRRVLESTGVVVMAHGRVVDEHLRRSHVTYSDIMAALRARGVPNPDLVQCVILESTGGLSVFDSGEPVDPRILDGVVGAELVTAGAPTDAEVRAAGARSARTPSPEGTGGRSPGVPESGDRAGESAGEAHRPGHGPADGPRR
ncbi:DUF421 domain-containing protein [Nocardia zapadnayensis]|nr:YetF domain-containing protein [Nocardia zapadnayensis]MCX0277893.1 DUF421 domain-containing protein [Nocardia zapadnayensis]